MGKRRDSSQVDAESGSGFGGLENEKETGIQLNYLAVVGQKVGLIGAGVGMKKGEVVNGRKGTSAGW